MKRLFMAMVLAILAFICGAASFACGGEHVHTWGEWGTVVPPTCTQEGIRERRCDACGQTEREPVAAASHTWSGWALQAEPACTQPGSEMRFCEVCSRTEVRAVDALGHDSVFVAETPAGCTEDGERAHYRCSRCGDAFADEDCTQPLGSVVLPATDHTYAEEWSHDESQHWHASTCEHTGLSRDRGMHDFQDGKTCLTCGYTPAYTLGLSYTLINDKSEYLVGIGTATDRDIVIPAERGGIPVTGIGNGAFSDSAVRSVTIPKSVTEIKDYAFEDCAFLESIVIPDSVRYIGNFAFYNCNSLQKITVGKGVELINDRAFANCPMLTEIAYQAEGQSVFTRRNAFYKSGAQGPGIAVTIAEGVTVIPASLFADAFVKSVALSDSVKVIGSEAFCGCKPLTTVSIGPDSAIEQIGSGAFSKCENLATMDLGNCSLTSIEASVFSGCTSLKQIALCVSVTTIGDSAFRQCTSLREIALPSRLTAIGEEAFYHCSALIGITIPEKVTEIGSYAFAGCGGLEEIIYNAEKCEVGISNGIFHTAGVDGKGINVIIGASVNFVPDYLFSPFDINFTTLRPKILSVEFAENGVCQSIGVEAFAACVPLKSIKISESVTSIGVRAFYRCDALESVTIGENVTFIGDHAFGFCPLLTSVVFEHPAGWQQALNLEKTEWKDVPASTLADPAATAFRLRDDSYAWRRTAASL